MNPDELHVDEERLRTGTGIKWRLDGPDVLPAWVADMDFPVARVIRDALRDAVDRSDLGYPCLPATDPVVAAFEHRMRTRFGWDPTPGRARVLTDLKQAFEVVLENATEPGDGVAVHVPAYRPFLDAIHRAGRRVVPLPVVDGPDGWDLTATGLVQHLAAQGVRLLVVVNPHNPTGRVLTRGELTGLADLAHALDVVVLADEIHADLALDGRRHVPFASLSPDAAARTVTATSATKAFSIAGLRCAVVHVGPDALRARLDAAPDGLGVVSTLASLATRTAWEHGDDWLAAVLALLQVNRDRVVAWAHETPGVRLHAPQGTYLAWLDLTGTGLAPADPAGDVLRRGHVRLVPGADFRRHTPAGTAGTAGFARLNYATSPEILDQVLDRVGGAVRSAR
jgi:cystathionine beta-lyase